MSARTALGAADASPPASLPPSRGATWTQHPLARRGALAAITLLGLALRLFAAWQKNASRPNSPARLRGDERGYDSLALDLLNGLGFTWPGRVPLYPLWLAALHRVGGHSYNFINYAQAFVGAAVVPLTYALARRFFGAGVALGAAALTAVSWVLIQQSVLLQSEILFTPAVLLVAIALHDALQRAEHGRPAALSFAWAGALVGISDMIRPTLILFPVAVALVAIVRLGARRGVRYGVIYVAAVGLVVLPWMVRNWNRYHAVLPLATSNAILWQGSPEYYHLVRDRGYTYLDVWEKVIYGKGDNAPDPGDVAGERYWRERALRSIHAEPLTYLRFAAEKAVTYWVGDPNADWDDTYVLNYHVLRGWGFTRWQTLQILAARLLVFPAFVAAFVLRRRWRDLLPVYALLVYCTLLHAATHAEARLSDPLQPLLGILIAGAVGAVGAALVRRARRGRASEARRAAAA